MISLGFLTGCDQSQELSGPDSGDETAALAQFGSATAPNMTIGSYAELIDRLPEIGTPLEGSRRRIPLSAEGDPLPTGAEHTTGFFRRRPAAYGLSGNVELPEPDAIGFTTSLPQASGTNGSGASEVEGSSSGAGQNRICLPGETPPGCEPPPPCCDDDDPPTFSGSSSLSSENVLRLGHTTANSTTDLEGGTIVDRVFASTQTSLVVDGGEYEDTGFTYTYSEPNENEVSAITYRHNYAGQTDYDNDGEHWYKDEGTPSEHKNSSASLQTNFPTSTCAPFPIWIVAGHEDGQTYQEDEEIYLEWQTICPQFAKEFLIVRTSGPSGSGAFRRWVSTSGDAWSRDALTLYRGLFLGAGDYEWRIRTVGETNYRTGTFSIASDCSEPVVDASRSSGIVDVTMDAGCLEPGQYKLRLRDGNFNLSNSVPFQVQGSDGDGNFSTSLPEPASFTGSPRIVQLLDTDNTLLDTEVYYRAFAIHPGL